MGTTTYIWNPIRDTVLMEKDETGATTASYTREPTQYGEVVSQRRDNETTYYHYDGTGSTRELTDSNEAVVNTNMYDAWGVNVDSNETVENPFTWNGKWGYYDDGPPGYHVRARTYEPVIARWASQDPLIFQDGVNRFRYASNTPILLQDPTGLICDSGTCCCCVDSLTYDPKSLTTKGKHIRPDTFGHYFELQAGISLRASEISQRCQLAWWEWWDKEPTRGKEKQWVNGTPQNELDDLYRKFGIGRCGTPGNTVDDDSPGYTISSWCRFFYPTQYAQRDCPSEHVIPLPDGPRIGLPRQNGRAASSRRLYFHVEISSSPGCGCDKSLTWEGCQFLEVDRTGAVVRQEFHAGRNRCPGFPPFSPVPKKAGSVPS